jgi:hypothetical protein
MRQNEAEDLALLLESTLAGHWAIVRVDPPDRGTVNNAKSTGEGDPVQCFGSVRDQNGRSGDRADFESEFGTNFRGRLGVYTDGGGAINQKSHNCPDRASTS